MDDVRLGSLRVALLVQTPGKECTSVESLSGQHMGASVPLRRELPTTVTKLPFLSCANCYTGIRSSFIIQLQHLC